MLNETVSDADTRKHTHGKCQPAPDEALRACEGTGEGIQVLLLSQKPENKLSFEKTATSINFQMI